MKLTFLTSGKIEYQIPGYSLYESIRLAANCERFPNLTEEGKSEVVEISKKLKKKNFVAIHTAPSEQAFQTAEIIAQDLNIPLIKDERLLPLKFDLTKIISVEEFEKSGDKAFDKLRIRFLDSFFENKLLEKNREVEIRFNSLKEDIKKKYKAESILFVSHAYLIKFFEIYSQIREELYVDREKLFRMFDPSKPTYGRLEKIDLTS